MDNLPASQDPVETLSPMQHEHQLLLLPEHTAGAASESTEAFGSGHGLAAGHEAFGRGKNPDKKKQDDSKNDKQKKHAGSGKKSKDDDDEEDNEKEDDEADEDDEDDKDHDDGEDEKKGKKKDKQEIDPKPKKPPLYKRPAFIITAIILLIVIVVVGIVFWLYIRRFVWTDDAYIDGNITQIAPQVSAPVKILHIDDNVYVKKGDLMVELDPTDYQVALEQAQTTVEAARGRLAQSEAQIGAAQATVAEDQAQIDAAQVQVDNTSRDLLRYQTVDPRARSQQQLDNAFTAAKNADAQLEQAKARKRSAEANVATSVAAVKAANGDLDKALADQHKAEVNLGYCRIVAPMDGRVTSRTIDPGTFVAVGQSMFSLVSPDVWVTANFKETQLTHMKVGQAVLIKIDAFPGKQWHGHIDSIQAGSGARFSVLPAENATGNFVKIVQRLPVKILFDHGSNTDDSRLLSPGLSVDPRVTVR
jgi:membrane fusion protein (multidrug efflux system)